MDTASVSEDTCTGENETTGSEDPAPAENEMRSEEPGQNRMSSLSVRVMVLEETISKLKLAQDEVKKRVEEVQQFSENVIEMQERKIVEIEENAKEQKKLLGEMRIQLQSLQNSKVNHKDVLIRHENQSKKLIELVNVMSAKQHEAEMERKHVENAKARRFSTFEENGRRTRGEELYYCHDRRHSGKRGGGGGGGGSGGGQERHHHRRVQSFPVEREKRKSTSRRSSEQF